ncbi:MAG: MarR family winged helix-turn-helix transcriptional regulator [Streptosporangiaceae bacterium]
MPAADREGVGEAGESPPDTALDRTLADALERVGQGMRVLLHDAARGHGMSPLQAQLLLRIAREPLSAREVGVLARLLDITQPTASDALAALRRKGLIERTTCGYDRRRATLAPTSLGRAVAGELRGWDERAVAALAAHPRAEKEDLLELLLGLIARLQRDGVVTVARMCVTCRFFRPERHAGAPAPHHCALLDLPLAPADLRVDCPDHQPLTDAPA